MPIVYEKLLALKIPEVAHGYGAKDCMLYALGVGLGLDPLDQQLKGAFGPSFTPLERSGDVFSWDPV